MKPSTKDSFDDSEEEEITKDLSDISEEEEQPKNAVTGEDFEKLTKKGSQTRR